MKRLIKNSENVIAEVVLVSATNIPEGWELVPSEEELDAQLSLAKRDKLAEIREKRDAMLFKNDILWLIASKKGEATTALEADADTLRDLPELAETELDALSDVEDIQAYDCFSGLALTGDYE